MDLSQVTLSQMRYAVAVAELGHFRQASERCHVTQSGLSMQVQKLEESLDVLLFDRSKKPIVVTDEGSLVLAQMRSILRETERLGQIALGDDQPKGNFRLGVIPTLSATVIPTFLRQFLEKYPEVTLVIEELTTDEIISRLEADTLDSGILATPLKVQGLEEEVLGRERMVAYLPPKDPLLRRKSLRQEHLECRPLWVMPEGHCFRSQVLSFCQRSGSESPVKFESGSFETLVRLVDQGLGATILPAMVASTLPARRRQAQVREFSNVVPVREIGMVYARGTYRRRVRQALVECIREALPSRLGATRRNEEVLSPLLD